MRLVIVAAIASSALSLAGCTQRTPDNDTAELRELVIRHLKDHWGTSHFPPDTHFVIETFDHRAGTIAVTGMFRSTGADQKRVGRFWVELQRDDSSWRPETIAITSMSDSNAEQIRWP